MELPKRRNKLDGVIRLRGYKGQRDFCRTHGFSEGYLSLVLAGKIFPGREGKQRLSSALGLTFKELDRLL